MPLQPSFYYLFACPIERFVVFCNSWQTVLPLQVPRFLSCFSFTLGLLPNTPDFCKCLNGEWSGALACIVTLGLFHFQTITLRFLSQARRRSQQDDFIMHRNAKFHTGRAPCNPIPWEQSGSSTSMFSSCHGYNGPLSCLFLGQWISNQRPAFHFNATRWFYCWGIMTQRSESNLEV